ncbi:hypothetical protein EWM64_g10116 [Hericium alpestre]|uniref:Uncharacterized protein n=1 Tax=Hericium alpestre TaxID=135208 RepID=A0A4Y9ZGJ7_9AGAM|nr:hypothetical protein EWM64_g10116 [Hericium alpestre]
MFWNDPQKGIKVEHDRHWQAMLPSTTRVPPAFTKTIAAEMLDHESPEVKAQVEVFRDSYNMSPVTMLDVDQARLELVQGAIDALPQTLDCIASSIE